MRDLVYYDPGDVKEAIERTKEANAYRREAVIRRFNGNKDAADTYIKHKGYRRSRNER